MASSRRQFLAPAGAAAASTAVRAGASPSPAGTADEARRLTSPGFLDLQVNGFAGVDFNDPATTVDDLHRALGVLRSHGVTRFLPTLITSSSRAVRPVRPAPLRAEDRRHRRHPHGRALHLPGGRPARRTSARVHRLGVDRRFQAAAGRGRREHPPGHARAGGARVVAAHRVPADQWHRVGIGHTAASAEHPRRRQGWRHACRRTWATARRR